MGESRITKDLFMVIGRSGRYCIVSVADSGNYVITPSGERATFATVKEAEAYRDQVVREMQSWGTHDGR